MHKKEEAIKLEMKEIDAILDKKLLTLNESQVAKVIGVSASTMANHRKEGKGIEYKQFGGRILYSKRVVAKWLVENNIKVA